MKMALVSDLHYDLNNGKGGDAPNKTGAGFIHKFIQDYVERPDAASVLLVAGDTANSPSAEITMMEIFSYYFEQVIAVDGNHTHYDDDILYEEGMGLLESHFQNYSNVTYLTPDHNLVLFDNEVAVIGANGWYDFHAPFCGDTEHQIERWKQESSDVRTFKSEKPEIEVVNLAKRDAMAVRLRLAEFHALKEMGKEPVRDVIVLTHTVPHKNLLTSDATSESYLAGGSMLNSMMGNLVDTSELMQHVKAWCFGHRHHVFERQVNGVQFFCNPYGYRWREGQYNPYGLFEFDSSDPANYEYVVP